MELALAALPGVVISCLFIWLLVRVFDKQNDERAAHRIEVDRVTTANGQQTAALVATHGEQIAKLTDAHRREVANLCQRLQAPQIAVAEHVGQTTIHDPAQVDIENDDLLSQIAQRELDLRLMEQSLTERAEELAAER